MDTVADATSETTAASSSATTAAMTDGSTTVDTDATTTDRSTGTAETTAGSTGDTDSDRYDGEWCGATGTGMQMVAQIDTEVRFAPSHGGPRAFVGWAAPDEGLQVAVYDVASATWGAAQTLQQDYSSVYSGYAFGAVDADGNALIAYAMTDHVVVQRYDGESGTWAPLDPTGAFAWVRIGGVSMTPGGHAVLVVYDYVGPGQNNAATIWYLDPGDDTWSAPTNLDVVEDLFYFDSVAFAQDPETGDTALAQTQASGVLLMQHRDAQTGEITTTELDDPATAWSMVALGDGEFMLLTSIGGWQEDWDLYAHYFDGDDWQPVEHVGSGYHLGSMRLVGRDDGRAVASWGDALWGTYVRAFDRDTGWAEELTASPSNPVGFEAWIDNRVAIDDDGFFVAWSSFFGDGSDGIHTSARRYDGADWEDAVDLDPLQSSSFSRVAWLDMLGPQRARAVWRLDSGRGSEAYGYACHTPISGWSDPVHVTDAVLRAEARPGGDVLVMGRNADASAWFEYYAAN